MSLKAIIGHPSSYYKNEGTLIATYVSTKTDAFLKGML